jgi:glycosyltransferase involved in cell wall biosynthesis
MFRLEEMFRGVVHRLRGEETEQQSRPLHVCHVVEQLAVGGIAAGLVPVVNSLDTDAFLVSCLSLGTRQPLVLEELEPRVQTWGLSFVPRPRLQGALVELFRRFQVDVVHTHGAGVLQAVAPAAGIAGVRAVVHTSYGEREPLPPGVTLTAASTPAALAMAGANGRDVAGIRVLPRGVDTERFRPPLDREALREALGLERAGLVVGSVSLAAGARVSLAALVSALRGRGVQATGLLVGGAGSGGERARKEGAKPRRALERSDQHHCQPLLETGPTRDVASRLAAMDLLVATGPAGFFAPASLLEGMASGLPVVAVVSPGVLDLRGEEGEESGLIVTDGPVEDELERLARDPDLRRRLGEGARGFARRRLRPSAVVDAYTAVYRDLGLADGMVASF